MSDKPQQDKVSVSRELEIWIDPDRQEGLPCIKGTRVPVHLVLRAIEQTGSIAGALRSYPQLTEQQVKDVLYFAQQRLLDSSEQTIRELQADKERLDSDFVLLRQFDGPHKVGAVILGFDGRPQRLEREDALGLTWKHITWREAIDAARGAEPGGGESSGPDSQPIGSGGKSSE